MTDNSKFKVDTTELLNKVIEFRRNYIVPAQCEPVHSSPSKLFESQLRLMLMIARTDEENASQKRVDAYC